MAIDTGRYPDGLAHRLGQAGPWVSMALLGALLVAACGGSGGAPASSSVAPASCAPSPGYSSVPDGTRVNDQADGFSITLPHGWAQIELATGNVVPAFSGLTMESRTAAVVKAIGASAERDGYEWLAVDLAAGTGGSPSATPSDLLVDLSPANGASLDTIAAQLTTDLRGSGVTGTIEQIRLVLAGGDALGIRYAAVTHDLDGKEIVSAVTDYIAVREMVRRICDHCAAYGQSFTLETGQEPANVLLEFFKDVDRANLGINFDPANMILYGTGDPVEALGVLAKHVISVHAKDGNWPPTDKPGLLGSEQPLGQGSVGMERFVAKLKEIGYTSSINVEREVESQAQRLADMAMGVSLLKSLI